MIFLLKKAAHNMVHRCTIMVHGCTAGVHGCTAGPRWPIIQNRPFRSSETIPVPELDSPTAVRVKVKATSLNYANYLQILGKYQEKPPLPFIPGSDYAGTVEAVGPSVTKFKVGDPVCSFASLGSYASFIVQDQSLLFGLPKGCDLVAAAALPVAFGTSHVALVHRANLASSQACTFLGAAGGVGVSAVQIGKVCGAVVIAVARGVEKVKFLKSLGVDHVVDLTNQNLIASVKEFLKSRNLKGVDVLYDPVGGKLTKDAMKLLNWSAQILVIGFASGEIPVIPANIALVKWKISYLGLQVVMDVLIGDPSLADSVSVPKSKSYLVLCWLPPLRDFLKMNVDGAIRFDGLVEVWVSVGRLIVESDCKSAVEWIQSPSSAPVFFNSLVKEILSLFSDKALFSSFRWLVLSFGKGTTMREVFNEAANFYKINEMSLNWTVHGLYWGSYRIHRPAVLEDSIRELLSWMQKGLITIHVSHTYSLSESGSAESQVRPCLELQQDQILSLSLDLQVFPSAFLVLELANLAFSAIKDRKAIGKVMIAFDDKGRSKL
ncbi:Alpha/beta-Hydrolases superfamily protein isoform 1 [Hibiscus syriacus]|uniref:Alpha/beta-Hydrolases superfamily protein isoform 1 n=1 Tax=Hibiscus syriacus TaxID=106335 RepID=A0A6A2XNH5_HIBSY|nr:Alpha/beta-Hydrolases superfamily protein isoform 1 [Hibiscus syriacus]